MAKKELTPEEIYKRNQKRAKIMRKIAPFVFWGFIGIAIVCFILAIHNSLGNINEIIQQLNSKKYTGEELQAHYNALVRYGKSHNGQGITVNLDGQKIYENTTAHAKKEGRIWSKA